MTGYDAIDHMVRYRKIETIQKVYVPVIAAVVAALALFVCFPRAGFVGDYAAIIALFAAAVTYLSGLAVTAVMMKDWDKRGQALSVANNERDKP
jgi:hypothetical protein